MIIIAAFSFRAANGSGKHWFLRDGQSLERIAENDGLSGNVSSNSDLGRRVFKADDDGSLARARQASYRDPAQRETRHPRPWPRRP